jgi:hypothetical protein
MVVKKISDPPDYQTASTEDIVQYIKFKLPFAHIAVVHDEMYERFMGDAAIVSAIREKGMTIVKMSEFNLDVESEKNC